MRLHNRFHFVGFGRATGFERVSNQSLLYKGLLNDKGYDSSKSSLSLPEFAAQKMGFAQRFHCGPEENSLSLALRAVQDALVDARVSPDRVELLVASSTTHTHSSHGLGEDIARELGLRGTTVLSLVHGCGGFVGGIEVMMSIMETKGMELAVLVCSETMESLLAPQAQSWEDSIPWIIFGNGAGAIVLQRSESQLGRKGGILYVDDRVDPDLIEHIFVPAGQRMNMADPRAVSQFAVKYFPHVITAALRETGISLDQVDWIVPHQTGHRILIPVYLRLFGSGGNKLEDLADIGAVMSEVGIRRNGGPGMYLNYQKYGNMSAASIPFALCEMKEQGLWDNGVYVMPAVGVGGHYGIVVYENLLTI